jgi:NagD protein
MTCVLVLSGVTTLAMVDRFPYQPDYIVEHVGEIDPDTILSRRERIKE